MYATALNKGGITPVVYTRASFPVLELSCAACATSVESRLRAEAGVRDVRVNYANQSAWIEYDAAKVNPVALQAAVRSIGYDLAVETGDPAAVKQGAERERYLKIKQKTIWVCLLTVPVVALGMVFPDLPYGHHASMIITAIVVFYFGRTFFKNAWKQARFGKANMDTLIALSTGIAFLFSGWNVFFPSSWPGDKHIYFESAAVVIAFVLIGKLLEEKAKSQVSSAIRRLLGMQPKTVTVITEGSERVVAIEEVKAGEIILVKPGERIAADGVVTEGSSYVEESMISGEPLPLEKKSHDKVFAGTINQRGSFQFKVEKAGSHTVLAHIMKRVEEAQSSKAPVQKLVDKIAAIFVPLVMVIAVLTFLLWMFFGGDNALSLAVLNSITVLVVACPCALGLATPTAIMVGIGKGAENHILIKDAESLELAYKVNTIVLDKTGTITEGKPAVTDFYWNLPVGQNIAPFKEIFYSMESSSEHPLGAAVVKNMRDDGLSLIRMDAFESITGRGIKAEEGGIQYFVGNKRFVDDHNVALPALVDEFAAPLYHEAKTVIYFFTTTEILAVVGIADRIKASSANTVRTLQRKGIFVYMLTGDNEETAKVVADQLGLNDFRAEVGPLEKAMFIKTLQEVGKVVAMVGDGINDANALAQADVSIAMGNGSDIAIDVASITLISSDLELVPKALNLSARTFKGIRQNLFWAFVYNVMGIGIAAGLMYPVNGFLLNPMIAGATMALSSVSVVMNSLRLRYARI